MTRYQLHVQNWKDCRRCSLHETRKHVVFVRGSVPLSDNSPNTDIVFIGESPGQTENLLGRPFSGPSGFLLDYIIKESVPSHLTFCITNLIGCIPLVDGNKISEPDDEWVKACSPKLKELVELTNPKLLVCVGSHARDWTEPGMKDSIKFHKPIHRCHIIHPAALLRQNFSIREISVRQCIVTIQDAIERMNENVTIK